MAATHLSLSWDRYDENIRAGFAKAQRDGDFVDLTLAAEGHLIGVHRLIVGIASPYMSGLIRSARCEHPVIYFNDMSHETLRSILEYVYSGEVVVPESELRSFLAAARTLRIRGLDGEVDAFEDDETTPTPERSSSRAEDATFESPRATSSNAARTTDGADAERPKDEVFDAIGDTETGSCENRDAIENLLPDIRLEPVSRPPSSGFANRELQYTVSTRGSLQLILNRYIYNIFSRSDNGNVRRWRCVDYRDHKCPACAVTSGNTVVKRTNMHNHPFHDKKIISKLEKGAIYSAIKVTDADS